MNTKAKYSEQDLRSMIVAIDTAREFIYSPSGQELQNYLLEARQLIANLLDEIAE